MKGCIIYSATILAAVAVVAFAVLAGVIPAANASQDAPTAAVAVARTGTVARHTFTRVTREPWTRWTSRCERRATERAWRCRATVTGRDATGTFHTRVRTDNTGHIRVIVVNAAIIR